jgi:hypothetical protein
MSAILLILVAFQIINNIRKAKYLLSPISKILLVSLKSKAEYILISTIQDTSIIQINFKQAICFLFDKNKYQNKIALSKHIKKNKSCL